MIRNLKMKRIITCFLPVVALVSLSGLLCRCIPEDLSDCPDSWVADVGVTVTVGLDTPASDNGQETQFP